MLIALDTSTVTASLALYDGRDVLAELTWRAERRHADALFPALERLLTLARAAIDDVDRVAVAVGPGSFTGVRIGIAVAKGLARGRGAPIAAIGSLDVLVYPYAVGERGICAHRPVCALLPAGGAERYYAFFDGPRLRSEYRAGTLADVAAASEGETVFVGELDADDESLLRDLLGESARFAPRAAGACRAGYLAELGWAALESGRAVGANELEPLYVKPPAVRTALGRGS